MILGNDETPKIYRLNYAIGIRGNIWHNLGRNFGILFDVGTPHTVLLIELSLGSSVIRPLVHHWSCWNCIILFPVFRTRVCIVVIFNSSLACGVLIVAIISSIS